GEDAGGHLVSIRRERNGAAPRHGDEGTDLAHHGGRREGSGEGRGGAGAPSRGPGLGGTGAPCRQLCGVGGGARRNRRGTAVLRWCSSPPSWPPSGRASPPVWPSRRPFSPARTPC